MTPAVRAKLRSLRRAFGVFLVAAIGCTSIRTDITYQETLLNTAKTVVSTGRDSRLVAQSVEGEDGATISVVNVETCSQTAANSFRRTKRTTRTASKRFVALEYLVGAAGLGGGAGVIYDAGSVPTSDDALERNPVGRDGAYAIGVGMVAVGTAALVAGITDSLRARDSSEDTGEIDHLVPDSKRDIECNKKPKSDLQIRLVAKDGRSVSVGATAVDGTLLVAWNVVPEEWFRATQWPETGVFVTEESDPIFHTRVAELARVQLNVARARVSEKAWGETQKANTSTAYRDYGTTYPEVHAEEARREHMRLRLAELDAAVGVALGAKDIKAAATLVGEWEMLDASAPALRARRDALGVIAREVKLDELGRGFEVALGAAIFKDRVAVDQLQGAAARLKELAALTPPDPLFDKRSSRLAQVQRKAVDVLIATAKRHAARSEWGEARSSLDAARQVTIGDVRLDRLATDYDRREEAQHRRQVAAETAQQARRVKRCDARCRTGAWRGRVVDGTKACLIEAMMRYGVNYAENTPGLPHQCAVDSLGLCTEVCIREE